MAIEVSDEVAQGVPPGPVCLGDGWPDDDWVDVTGPPEEWTEIPVRELVEMAAHLPKGGDPIDQVVDRLRAVDRAMAVALRQLPEAGPRDGLSARRQVAVMANATASDAGFLDRAVDALRAMPLTWQAFDDGLLSWGQVRGIVCQARRLTVAQRERLDVALAGQIADGRLGEPDRIVEVAGDLAARLDEVAQERDELAQERQQRLVLQPDFDGWGDIHGTLCPEIFASVGEALDAMADAPVAADASPATDDDGRVLPKAARPPTSRGAQWAEALGRMAALALGGTSADGTLRRAKPRVTVIARLADLVAAERAWEAARHADDATAAPTAADVLAGPAGITDDRVGLAVSRLLMRRGNGRRRTTRALTRALADNADLIALFVDEHGMPVAIGDSYAPITDAMRRAVEARDQGCRAPGCSAPAHHCDVHHVIPRERNGPTEVQKLVLMCRPCHTRLSLHRWRMTLQADGTLTTRIGRTDYTTRPRITAPVLGKRHTDRSDQPVPF